MVIFHSYVNVYQRVEQMDKRGMDQTHTLPGEGVHLKGGCGSVAPGLSNIDGLKRITGKIERHIKRYL